MNDCRKITRTTLRGKNEQIGKVDKVPNSVSHERLKLSSCMALCVSPYQYGPQRVPSNVTRRLQAKHSFQPCHKHPILHMIPSKKGQFLMVAANSFIPFSAPSYKQTHATHISSLIPLHIFYNLIQAISVSSSSRTSFF